MKRKKTIGIIVGVLAICVAAVLLFGNRKECCLCNAPTSSAPCLVDLETGAILELRLDGPSTTPGPEGQTNVSTFSFIRFGSVTGTKQTAPNVITLKIPVGDKSQAPALCRNCRKLLPNGYTGRYALSDVANGVLFPLAAETEITICDCGITMVQRRVHYYFHKVSPSLHFFTLRSSHCQGKHVLCDLSVEKFCLYLKFRTFPKNLAERWPCAMLI